MRIGDRLRVARYWSGGNGAALRDVPPSATLRAAPIRSSFLATEARSCASARTVRANAQGSSRRWRARSPRGCIVRRDGLGRPGFAIGAQSNEPHAARASNPRLEPSLSCARETGSGDRSSTATRGHRALHVGLDDRVSPRARCVRASKEVSSRVDRGRLHGRGERAPVGVSRAARPPSVKNRLKSGVSKLRQRPRAFRQHVRAHRTACFSWFFEGRGLRRPRCAV